MAKRLQRLGVSAFTVVVLVGCRPNPSTPPATQSSTAATLTVTGSGELGGPWWMGPGAVFAVEPSGWTVADGWAPSVADTIFEVRLVAGSDGPMPVTGIRQRGQDRIEWGPSAFIVMLTRLPDSPPSAPLSAFFGCSAPVNIPIGTRAVGVGVVFGSGQSQCTIAVSMESATPAPSP